MSPPPSAITTTARLRVATKYINLTRDFFAAHGIIDYRIVESSGATEGAPAAGTAEMIVDITTTGTTLAANGLKVVEDGVILRSQANLVAARGGAWGASERETARVILDRMAAQARARAFREVRARFAACDARLVESAKQKFGVETPFGGPTSSGMLTLHCPPEQVYALTSFLRENGAEAVAVADLDYVFSKDNPLYAKLEAGLSASPRAQLHLDIGGLDHRPPFLHLGLLMGGEHLRRLLGARRHFEPDIGEALAHRRIGQRLDHRGVELGDNILRRSLRHPERRPQFDVEAGQAGFIHRRNVGRRRYALGRRNGIGADFSGLHLRQRVRRLIDDHVDLPGHQVVQRRTGAAIGHELQLHADQLLEIDAGEMRTGADAGGAGRTLPSLALIQAISSFRFFAGTAFLDTIIIGLLATIATGSRSFTRSKVSG